MGVTETVGWGVGRRGQDPLVGLLGGQTETVAVLSGVAADGKSVARPEVAADEVETGRRPVPVDKGPGPVRVRVPVSPHGWYPSEELRDSDSSL